MTKNQLEVKEDYTQDTNLTNNELEIKENSAQDTNVKSQSTKNQRKHCETH